MLYNHFIEELLGLQGVKITNVEQEENLIIHLEKKNRRNFPKHIEDILKTLKSYCWKDLINQKTNSNSKFWLCQKLLWTLAGLIGTRKNSLKYLTARTVKPSKKKCRNGFIMPQTAVYRSLRNVLTLCKIGSPVYWILFHHLRQTRIIRIRPKRRIFGVFSFVVFIRRKPYRILRIKIHTKITLVLGRRFFEERIFCRARHKTQLILTD